MRSIEIEWEGERYLLPHDADSKTLILLPNGKLLCTTGWLESLPPQPAGLRECKPNEVPYVKAHGVSDR